MSPNSAIVFIFCIPSSKNSDFGKPVLNLEKQNLKKRIILFIWIKVRLYYQILFFDNLIEEE